MTNETTEQRYLHVERWVNGDTEERQPMYCLYLSDSPELDVHGKWFRIGDVWEQEGADYLNALEAEVARLRAALEDMAKEAEKHADFTHVCSCNWHELVGKWAREALEPAALTPAPSPTEEV